MVELGNGIAVDDLLIHDETAEEPSLAYLLSRMVCTRDFPECVGVFRAVERPTYEEQLDGQIAADIAKRARATSTNSSGPTICGRSSEWSAVRRKLSSSRLARRLRSSSRRTTDRGRIR